MRVRQAGDGGVTRVALLKAPSKTRFCSRAALSACVGSSKDSKTARRLSAAATTDFAQYFQRTRHRLANVDLQFLQCVAL